MSVIDENVAQVIERLTKEGAKAEIDVNGNNIILIPEGMKLETIHKADWWKSFKKKANIAAQSAFITLIVVLAIQLVLINTYLEVSLR